MHMENPDAILQQAATLHLHGRLDEARADYQRLLQLNPNHVRALHYLGILSIQTGQAELAVELLSKALLIDPADAALHASKGDALCELNQMQAAVASYDAAIAILPGDANTHFNKGNTLRLWGKHADAISSYDRALALDPGNADACNNRGISLLELKRYAEAMVSFQATIARNPNYTAAYHNWGNALFETRAYEEGIAKFDRAIALDPRHMDAHLNRAAALIKLDRYDAAITCLDKVIALDPRHPGAFMNRGGALASLKRYEAAIASYDQVVALQPDSAAAYYNRGNACLELKQYKNAIANYDRAIGLGCDSPGLPGLRLNAGMQLCDWRDFDQQVARLVAGIEADKPASQPFYVFSTCESALLQLRAAGTWVREECQPGPALPTLAKRGRAEKIRIGYFSPDFCNHPVSLLTAGLFEAHDRMRFEVTAFSLGPDTGDPVRKRLERAFDRFHNVADRSDQEIALLARKSGIDIAVDMSGITRNSRPKLFALRVAPLQISYLGYPGTLGAPFMDYLIADGVIIPPSHQHFYAERILYIPSYQPNDSRRPIADATFARAELGLPSSAFVFCCFSTSYKITPCAFDSWMRILARVPRSVLWLRSDDRTTMANLRQQAEGRGVASERLVFAPAVPSMERHLARYRGADLFLDTWPYGAHTTASDALWAGLPVLTCAGETFASRVAASLLTSVGLPELIAWGPERYEELAIELANDAARLTELRQRLSDRRLTSALFDTGQYTRHLEAGYTAIVDRYQTGLPPAHIECTGSGK